MIELKHSTISKPNSTSFEYYEVMDHNKKIQIFKRSEKIEGSFYQLMLKGISNEPETLLIITKFIIKKEKNQWKLEKVNEFVMKISTQSISEIMKMPSIHQFYEEIYKKIKSDHKSRPVIPDHSKGMQKKIKSHYIY